MEKKDKAPAPPAKREDNEPKVSVLSPDVADETPDGNLGADDEEQRLADYEAEAKAIFDKEHCRVVWRVGGYWFLKEAFAREHAKVGQQAVVKYERFK